MKCIKMSTKMIALLCNRIKKYSIVFQNHDFNIEKWYFYKKADIKNEFSEIQMKIRKNCIKIS